MEVYMNDTISNIRNYHGDVIRNIWQYKTIKEYLEEYAYSLSIAHKNGEIGFANEVNNYYKPFFGVDADKIMKTAFDKGEFLNISASVHGFESFSKVDEKLGFNPVFEKAVDAVITGNKENLSLLIKENPEIVSGVSSFGHRATLLHYCAPNGVELWRQIVPNNLDQIVSYLLDKGADLHAKMEVYGGVFTFEELFFTSAHPVEAGVVDKVKSILC